MCNRFLGVPAVAGLRGTKVELSDIPDKECPIARKAPTGLKEGVPPNGMTVRKTYVVWSW